MPSDHQKYSKEKMTNQTPSIFESYFESAACLSILAL